MTNVAECAVPVIWDFKNAWRTFGIWHSSCNRMFSNVLVVLDA
jgi:hypothetical protein